MGVPDTGVGQSADGRARLLYVDDDPDFAALAADMLERADDRLDVTVVHDADSGLERLGGDSVDCVVSDYDMPGRTGLEFLRAVRESHPELPFVLFTGKGSEEVASEALRAGATDYLRKGGTNDRYELLANRVLNAVEQYRARRRAANLDRVRTLASDVKEALLRAECRADLERAVCETISDADPYQFAWVGAVDPETDHIEPRTAVGQGGGYLDEITVAADESEAGRGPAGRAVRTRSVAVSQDIEADPEFERWREAALQRGYRAVAGVPLVYEDSLYGVLAVYAERAHAFDEAERRLLADLGDDIAHAINSMETRARLEEERDLRAALFENAPVPVVTGGVDGDERPVVDANEAFEAVFGLNREAVVGRDVTEVLVPDGRTDRYRSIRRRANEGERVVEEVRRETADGIREFLLHVVPSGGDAGPEDRWYAWYTDISDRKDRERELERYETLVETLGDGVIAVDPDGTYSYVNSQFEDRTGYDRDRLVGARPETVLDEATVADFEAAIREMVAGDRDAYATEVTVETADGDTFPAETKIAPVFVDGVFQGTVGVVRDVTDWKQRERELKRQNERLEEFAGVVSHDLRNPLNVATSRLELAADGRDSPHIDAAETALDRMADLIDDLLALARSGDAARAPEPLALGAVCRRCWETVETHEATLRMAADTRVRADPEGLRRALENLFRNAVEHGGPAVCVEVGETEAGFYVADDGPGIPADERDRVVEAGYSTGDEGTGFGLAIVEEVADAHGWEFSVADSRHGGARFEFHIGVN